MTMDASPFVIVGAGGMGRELLGWIACCSEAKRARFQVEAFISEWDDVGTLCHGLAVEPVRAYEGRTPRYLIAIGDSAERKRLALMLDAAGWIPETFIHDTAVVGLNAKIGAGTIVFPYCRIASDSTIGEHVVVNSGSGVGHDAIVGSFATLLGAVSINGHVIVGEGATFGAGSMVYPKKKIGAWARIGLGSVVLRSVPDNVTVFGNPAQLVGGKKAT
jgi:acetyltransferase EpsM